MIDEEHIKTVELFAGVGGFRVGLERCSDAFRFVWANQYEPKQKRQWAYDCYISHFPDGVCVNADIATVTNQVPAHDLLVGGFPCQDYSVANSNARGIVGEKGVLWWSIYEIIKNHWPSYILLENVDRLLKSPSNGRGGDFCIILNCLAEMGYRVEWRVINAAEYGFAQKRKRVFIFAFNDKTGIFYQSKNHDLFSLLTEYGFFARCFPVKNKHDKKRTVIDSICDNPTNETYFYNGGIMQDKKVYSENLIPDYSGQYSVLNDIISNDSVEEKYFISDKDFEKYRYLKNRKTINRISKTGFSYCFSEGAIPFPDLSNKPSRTILTSEGTISRSTHVVIDKKTKRLRVLTPEECERLNGFQPGWTNTGMPERQRYFIMGNALVVPLIEIMGKRLLEIV